jgi:superfamily I DNA/RNA helicase
MAEFGWVRRNSIFAAFSGIALGADPRRIMLLTFSRRAAAEMQRRVERITVEALGPHGGEIARALPWSGTFHAIGARLLHLLQISEPSPAWTPQRTNKYLPPWRRFMTSLSAVNGRNDYAWTAK